MQRAPRSAAHPEIDRPDSFTVLDNFVREADLPIELQRPGLDRERPGGGAALSGTVDEAHRHPSRVSQSARTSPVGPAPAIST